MGPEMFEKIFEGKCPCSVMVKNGQKIVKNWSIDLFRHGQKIAKLVKKVTLGYFSEMFKPICISAWSKLVKKLPKKLPLEINTEMFEPILEGKCSRSVMVKKTIQG